MIIEYVHGSGIKVLEKEDKDPDLKNTTISWIITTFP